jgi:molecular chaperone Hsp33
VSRAGEPAPIIDPLSGRDDMVAAFQLEGRPVRGRIARLGAVADEILAAHDYPAPVARLVGEAAILAALIGDALKFDGRLILQATGDGPVPMLVADFETGGRVRAYAKVDREAYDKLAAAGGAEGAAALLGGGNLAMSIDQGPDFDLYQSLAPIEGARLSDVAERYFEQSEQVPTRVRLAVAENHTEHGRTWRAGGALLQQLAGDDARGDTDEEWENARLLFETLEPVELVDPELSAGAVLFRLFHEDGVRIFPATKLEKRCTCTRASVARVLASFPRAEVDDLAESDGRVRVTCEYCNKDFRFLPADLEAEARGGGS